MIEPVEQAEIGARILQGDCLQILKELPDNSIDSCVTDPPAAISFMGKSWDGDRGGRAQWVAWLSEVMAEVLRVVKPGAHALVWALPRTSHWTALALEDAGWEIRDRIAHHFGSGFPKSANISKHIDKMGGANIGWFGPWLREERKRRRITQKELAQHFPSKTGGLTGCVANWELGLNIPTVEQFNILCEVLGLPFERLEEAEREVIGKSPNGFGPNNGSSLTHTMQAHPDVTAPATEEAKRWEGWGSALKPATEDWWLCRKPLSEKNLAQNVLKHGTGGLNIDQSRIKSGIEEGRLPGTMKECEPNHEHSPANSAGSSMKHGEAVGSTGSVVTSVEDLLLEGESTTHSDSPIKRDMSGSSTGTIRLVSMSTNSSIDGSGEKQGEKSPMDTSYTMSAKTSPITSSKTLNSCPEAHTEDFITESQTNTPMEEAPPHTTSGGEKTTPNIKPSTQPENGSAAASGRWPSNLLLSHVPGPNGCQRVGSRRVKGQNGGGMNRSGVGNNVYSEQVGHPRVKEVGYADPDGLEEVAAWDCVEFCPVRLLDEQSGVSKDSIVVRGKQAVSHFGNAGSPQVDIGYGGEGGAARFFKTFDGEPGFFYVPKASRAERNKGLEGMPEKESRRYGDRNAGSLPQQTPQSTIKMQNTHPTVKPTKLLSYLIRLVTPPGGTTLDCFAGSGSTGVAAISEGFNAILIEAEPEYVEIAERRCAHALNERTDRLPF